MTRVEYDCVVIGGGFTGLSAAYKLAKSGKRVAVVEQDSSLGGLAGCFEVQGTKLEKFYHHWFNHDHFVLDLVHELGLGSKLVYRNSNTGVFLNNKAYRLSRPWDLLKFSPLSLIGRMRLGMMTLASRRIEFSEHLENITAEQWLVKLGGQKVFDAVWKPLLDGKFGRYSRDLSAVWIWNKLKLRGGSRSAGGKEQLVYLRGGFDAIAEKMSEKIIASGGSVFLGAEVVSFYKEQSCVKGLTTSNGATIIASTVLATVPLPILAKLLRLSGFQQVAPQFEKIKYLGNVCQVLVLNRSLSSTYWLNVNDPGFPFVGVIEHTNFEPTDSYKGKHIVYLSKYLPVDDELYSMNAAEFRDFSIPYLKKMFPDFQEDWIEESFLWKSPFSQPLVECNFSKLIPPMHGLVPGLFVASMAQIYPEDRGTNYAVRAGFEAADRILNQAQMALEKSAA